MADSGIRKVAIPIASAIPVSEKTDNDPTNNYASRLLYLLRYRITSDDGAKYSAWSSKYALSSQKIIDVYNGGNSITNKTISTGTDMTITWNIPSGLINNTFDIYTRWGSIVGSTEYSITNAVLSSGIITFTTSVAHGLSVNSSYSDGNDRVAIYSMDAALNGSYTITSIPTTTSFTIKSPVTSLTLTTGKIKKILFDTTTTYATTATGTSGINTITVASATGLKIGMTVISSTGVATNASITGITGTTITLDSNNISTVSGNITFQDLNGFWKYSATTTSNSFHVAIPSGFLPPSLGTPIAGTTPAQYIYFLDIYVQIQANPKQLSYSTASSIQTAILNPIGKLFNKVISTYQTTIDSGKLG